MKNDNYLNLLKESAQYKPYSLLIENIDVIPNKGVGKSLQEETVTKNPKYGEISIDITDEINPNTVYGRPSKKAKGFWIDPQQLLPKDLLQMHISGRDVSVESSEQIRILFEKKFLSRMKKGDTVFFGGYRNTDRWISDGKQLVSLYYEYDDYGSLPPEFTYPEFPIDYWSIDEIDHGRLVWIDLKKPTPLAKKLVELNKRYIKERNPVYVKIGNISWTLVSYNSSKGLQMQSYRQLKYDPRTKNRILLSASSPIF